MDLVGFASPRTSRRILSAVSRLNVSLAATVAHVGGDTVNEHILSIDSEYLFDTLFLPCV